MGKNILIMEVKTINYQGKKRPLVYIINYGEVYINEGDTLEIKGKYVYKNDVFIYKEYHRHLCYSSNLLPLDLLIGTNDKDRAELIDRMLSGEFETPLEITHRRVKESALNLPKRDITVARYQFSNSIRPTSKYKYKDGLYYGSNVNGGTPERMASYMYYNLYRVLPEGVESVNAAEYEALPELYND